MSDQAPLEPVTATAVTRSGKCDRRRATTIAWHSTPSSTNEIRARVSAAHAVHAGADRTGDADADFVLTGGLVQSRRPRSRCGATPNRRQ
jgi:hypothetical protein